MAGIQTISKFIGLKRGSHRLPRFIYHMTSKSNYEKIVESGSIKPIQDGFFRCPGVFTTDLSNLFTSWGKNPLVGNESLQKLLLEQVAKDTDNIVILRIPIARLDKGALSIRSQNKYATWVHSCEYDKITCESAIEANKTVSILKDEDKWDELFRKYIKEHIPTAYRELVTGLPAKCRNLLKQRKVPFEYIYQKKIPAQDFEKIGEVNLKAVKQSANYDPQHPIRSIFNAMLQGTPEQKATVMIKE